MVAQSKMPSRADEERYAHTAVEKLTIPAADKQKIYEGNARRLLKLN